MNCKLFNVFIFAAGAAIGSAVTWKLVKTKYERIAQEEINSIKEVYSKRETDLKDDVDRAYELMDEHEIATVKAMEEYKELVSMNSYTGMDIDETTDEEKGDETMDDSMIEVIPPDELSERDDYETETLWYFADGVLTDVDNNVIDDPEGLVGDKALDSFGEYEDDAVCVRNDELATYYEILRDLRKFSEVYPEE